MNVILEHALQFMSPLEVWKLRNKSCIAHYGMNRGFLTKLEAKKFLDGEWTLPRITLILFKYHDQLLHCVVKNPFINDELRALLICFFKGNSTLREPLLEYVQNFHVIRYTNINRIESNRILHLLKPGDAMYLHPIKFIWGDGYLIAKYNETTICILDENVLFYPECYDETDALKKAIFHLSSSFHFEAILEHEDCVI